ncbi:MAG: hypothetical protein KUG80_01415 [Gammaproteobacteria bacterium]|nr:hypothetical protein [Gammaproteobacteria bacterium]
MVNINYSDPIEILVDLDYDKLARLDLTVADVARTLRLAYDGEEVTRVRYGDEEVKFRVLLDSSARASTTALATRHLSAQLTTAD